MSGSDKIGLLLGCVVLGFAIFVFIRDYLCIKRLRNKTAPSVLCLAKVVLTYPHGNPLETHTEYVLIRMPNPDVIMSEDYDKVINLFRYKEVGGYMPLPIQWNHISFIREVI